MVAAWGGRVGEVDIDQKAQIFSYKMNRFQALGSARQVQAHSTTLYT